MTDTIIPTDDLSDARNFIAQVRREIDKRRQACYEKVRRIRQQARVDEDNEHERLYFETEPLRKQMEAMIQTLTTYEASKGQRR